MTDAIPQPERSAKALKLSNNSNYSPETELPLNIARSAWAKSLWAKRHEKGPYCVVFRLYPLHIYVAGWISWAGSLCVPALVDGFADPEPWEVEFAVAELGQLVFQRGPSESMIAESARIAAEFAKNGSKGGQAKKAIAKAKTAAAKAAKIRSTAKRK
jgi:hypothetical protein